MRPLHASVTLSIALLLPSLCGAQGLILDGQDTSAPAVTASGTRPSAGVRGPREIEPEVIPSPASTFPGSVVRLIYSVLNFEEMDVRVRLRVDLPPGWTVLTPEFAAQEYTIPAGDEVDGEILVTVPKDATPGQRALVKFIAEVSGEAGVYEGQNLVSITRGGGIKPGQTALQGTATVGFSRLTPSGVDARGAGGVALSGKLDPQTTVSVSAGRDLNDSVTNYRYNFEPTRITGTVRRRGFDVTFGNVLSSAGTALTGPAVRARGVSVRQATGPWLGEVLVAQPTTFIGEASGYVVRGRAGLTRSFGSLSFVASDFNRPRGYTMLLPPVDVLDPDEAERQARERRLAESTARNRVLGAGLEADLRRGSVHRFTARAGTLYLANAAGLARHEPTGDAAYGFNTRDLTLNLRWRDMPDSLEGVQIGGDEVWADAAVRIVGEFRLTAQRYTSSFVTTGQLFPSLSDGTSFGGRYNRGGFRIDARANQRDTAFDSATSRRSGSMYFGFPIGPMSVNAGGEVGETHGPHGRQPLALVNTNLRWAGRAGFASVAISQVQSGGQPTQRRIDLLGSAKAGLYEFSGGAWITDGYVSGGYPGVWTSAGVPIFLDLTAVVGVEYAPLTWTSRPDWRGSFSLRRPLTVPLDFLKPKRAPRLP